MDDTQLSELVGHGAVVAAGRPGDETYVGTIVASGRDAIRGQWIMLRTDDGQTVEIAERVPLPLRIEIVDPGKDPTP